MCGFTRVGRAFGSTGFFVFITHIITIQNIHAADRGRRRAAISSSFPPVRHLTKRYVARYYQHPNWILARERRRGAATPVHDGQPSVIECRILIVPLIGPIIERIMGGLSFCWIFRPSDAVLSVTRHSRILILQLIVPNGVFEMGYLNLMILIDCLLLDVLTVMYQN